ncbi:unnamed protein product [Miscanthus lutarioriparius]|uniref:Ubiquitin-like protease family profile domain-containing protein n=1 Tax=Miscanthus lutarioriparius TaxID=422564 RepID=A0A811MJN1_9POAL|nr:unnamed protein product [Miscanthus lutarioriparius]
MGREKKRAAPDRSDEDEDRKKRPAARDRSDEDDTEDESLSEGATDTEDESHSEGATNIASTDIAEDGAKHKSALSRSSLKTVSDVAKTLSKDAESHVRRVGFDAMLEYTLEKLETRELLMWISPEKYVLVNPEAVNNVLGTPFNDNLADSVSGDKSGVLKAMFDEFEAAGIKVDYVTRKFNKRLNEFQTKVKKQISLEALKQYMQWIKDNNKGSEKEAQVFFYILFNRLLMPSSDSNLTGKNILCGDLEKIGTINWSKVICKHLKEGVIKRRERKKKVGLKSESIAWGCTFVLADKKGKEDKKGKKQDKKRDGAKRWESEQDMCKDKGMLLPSVDHLLQASMDKVPEVQDEMNALVKGYQSFVKKKFDEIRAYQSSVVTQAMSLEEKVRETNKFYAEHIESKARFTDDTIVMEDKDKEVIENMKITPAMDISGHKLCEFKFVESLKPTGELSNFIVDALAYLWNKDWKDKDKVMLSQGAVHELLGKDNRTGFLAREIPRATLAHKDLVCFVPILDGRHWSLAVLELQKQRISILDSLKISWFYVLALPSSDEIEGITNSEEHVLLERCDL